MMKMIYFLCAAFFPILVLASEETYRVYSSKEKIYESLVIVDYQGIKISKSCFKGKVPKCKSWSAVKNKVERSTSPTPLLGNPAARYCLDHGSTNRIYFNSKDQEFDFCFFSDGSSVDAWSLYNKHYGNKR